MFPMKSNGASRDESTTGAVVKMRISRSELKYGDLRPYNPVFALADTRMFRHGHGLHVYQQRNRGIWI
jgi:imipenem/basic amino acid-specific outer membrane pore